MEMIFSTEIAWNIRSKVDNATKYGDATVFWLDKIVLINSSNNNMISVALNFRLFRMNQANVSLFNVILLGGCFTFLHYIHHAWTVMQPPVQQ